MNRVALIMLAAVVIAAIAVIAGTSSELPARLATSFGASGAPSGWETRHDYLTMMIGGVIGAPLLIMLALAWLPRVAPRLMNLPHRDYWLAPARRGDTLRSLFAFGCLLAIVLVVFLVALHLLIVRAQMHNPPELPLVPFVVLTGALLVAAGLWAAAWYRRFPRPR